MSKVLLGLMLALHCVIVSANNDYLEQLINQANAQELASDSYWQKLIHYKKNLFGGYTSQADDPDYFLSINGKTQPDEELYATIRAFFADDEGDNNPQCRFPARYHWLKSKLKFDNTRLKERVCPAIEEWKITLNVQSITLVFPSSYLNSPSSMFGHTLLRVNPSDHRKNVPLAAYALNYAANIREGENGLVFAYKGIFGGYPGIFSIVPYYEKIKEYSDIENRDIWEYHLDFSREEVEQLMRHAWELRHITFDYYFFSENCSYHMLSLLEVGRPGLNLTDGFNYKAIPSDTVRAVKDAGIVAEVIYRPSSSTQFLQRLDVLTEQERESVERLYENKIAIYDLKEMPHDRKAMVIEQTFDYSRYRALRAHEQRDTQARQNYELLVERSKLDTVGSVWPEINVPGVRADEGHLTSRFAMAVGEKNNDQVMSLYYRPAYHDVLDPWQGYGTGAQINFLDFVFDYNFDDDELVLNKLTVIDILSITPRNEFFSPLSWYVDTGIELLDARPEKEHVAQVGGGAAYSYRFGRNHLLSAGFKAKLNVGDKLDKGYSMGAGIKASLLMNYTFSISQFEIEGLRFGSGEKNDFYKIAYNQSLYGSFNYSLRLKLSRQYDYEIYDNRSEIMWNWYF